MASIRTRWRSRHTAQFGDERIVLATSGGQGERLIRSRKDGKIASDSLDDEHIATLIQHGFHHREETAS